MIDSFTGFLSAVDQEYHDRVALRWDDQEGRLYSATFGQFAADVRKCAAALCGRIAEINRKHIAIMAENSYECCVCTFGVLFAGGAAVMMNPYESLETLQYQLAKADVDYVIHDGISPIAGDAQYSDMLLDIGFYQDCQTVCEQPPHESSDVAFMLFTSGTTGKSKCVMISSKSVFASLNGMMQYSKMLTMHSYKVLLIYRLYHAAGVAGWLNDMAMGWEVGICRDIKYIFRNLRDYHSSTFSAPPMVFDLFAKELRLGNRDRLADLESVNVGTAKMDTEKCALFFDNGIAVGYGYGMTEVFAAGTLNNYSDRSKIDSVGKPSAGIEIRIMDGEVCIKGDAVMMGYYKDPEATAEAIRDGWLHTGDLGYLDEDGYLYITGRKKNLIILASGENVSPEELEALLLKNKDIRETLVKEKNGKISAEIFCNEDKRQELRGFVTEVNRSLPFYKRMTLVEFRAEPFEKTASGKIKRA